MPDIVLGGLIGIGGAIVGAIIAAISSYRIARLQINTRREELSQQHKYDEQQARIDRLVRDRERVLVPLREVLSKWMQVTKQDQQMLVRLEKAYKRVKEVYTKDNAAELEKELQVYKEVAGKSTEVTSELAVLQGLISDSTLDKMIEAAKNAHWETAPERTELDRLFNNPQNTDTNALLSSIEKYDSILNNLRGYLLTVNKRIEDLLSGEPSN